MNIYKNQQDRTEIQNQYDYELRQYEEISSLSNDNLLALGFILQNPKDPVKHFFTFFIENEVGWFTVPNVSTTRDLINLINLFK
jgi:hypothetical protein